MLGVIISVILVNRFLIPIVSAICYNFNAIFSAAAAVAKPIIYGNMCIFGPFRFSHIPGLSEMIKTNKVVNMGKFDETILFRNDAVAAILKDIENYTRECMTMLTNLESIRKAVLDDGKDLGFTDFTSMANAYVSNNADFLSYGLGFGLGSITIMVTMIQLYPFVAKAAGVKWLFFPNFSAYNLASSCFDSFRHVNNNPFLCNISKENGHCIITVKQPPEVTNKLISITLRSTSEETIPSKTELFFKYVLENHPDIMLNSMDNFVELNSFASHCIISLK
jgi:hypothetical protein